MTGRIRLGIVGFDHPHVLRFAPMLAANPDVKLAWISEDGVNRPAAEAMARSLGIPRLDEPGDEIDAAYIATRPGLHLEMVRLLADRGIHILCDKPIALSEAEGREIVVIGRRAGIHLMVPFNPRGQVGPRAVKERIDRGELGEIRLVHAVKIGKVPLSIPGIDGGWLVDPAQAGFGGFGDIGMHAMDALRWLIGREPRRVFARIHRGAQPGLAVDSIGTATIEWDGGALSTLTAGWANPPGFPSFLDARFEVVGTKGAARVEAPYQELRLSDTTHYERLAAARTDAVWNLNEFISALREDREPAITGEDGLAALRLMLACYRSSEAGDAVLLEG